MSGEGNSKLTEPRIEAALNALEMGCTRRAAAGAAGVTATTFYRWLEDVAFRDAVEKAENKAEATYIAAVANAVPRNWQAAAWWLERRHHEDFAQRSKVEMSVDLRAEVKRVAAERGLDEDAVMAEADAILAGRRR